MAFCGQQPCVNKRGQRRTQRVAGAAGKETVIQISVCLRDAAYSQHGEDVSQQPRPKDSSGHVCCCWSLCVKCFRLLCPHTDIQHHLIGCFQQANMTQAGRRKRNDELHSQPDAIDATEEEEWSGDCCSAVNTVKGPFMLFYERHKVKVCGCATLIWRCRKKQIWMFIKMLDWRATVGLSRSVSFGEHHRGEHQKTSNASQFCFTLFLLFKLAQIKCYVVFVCSLIVYLLPCNSRLVGLKSANFVYRFKVTLKAEQELGPSPVERRI